MVEEPGDVVTWSEYQLVFPYSSAAHKIKLIEDQRDTPEALKSQLNVNSALYESPYGKRTIPLSPAGTSTGDMVHMNSADELEILSTLLKFTRKVAVGSTAATPESKFSKLYVEDTFMTTLSEIVAY